MTITEPEAVDLPTPTGPMRTYVLHPTAPGRYPGRQDPHVPREGRQIVYNALADAGTNFTWHEFNGQHAFLRDEGHRYDPELARIGYGLTLDLFHRKLGEGDLRAAPSGAAESKH